MLRDNHVLTCVDRMAQLGPRNPIEDVKYRLVPHPEFVREVKAANHRLVVRVV